MVGERDRRPSFDIFVVCSTSIVGGGRPRETKVFLEPGVIASFVFQFFLGMSYAG